MYAVCVCVTGWGMWDDNRTQQQSGISILTTNITTVVIRSFLWVQKSASSINVCVCVQPSWTCKEMRSAGFWQGCSQRLLRRSRCGRLAVSFQLQTWWWSSAEMISQPRLCSRRVVIKPLQHLECVCRDSRPPPPPPPPARELPAEASGSQNPPSPFMARLSFLSCAISHQ